jgi:hypothetical protein
VTFDEALEHLRNGRFLRRGKGWSDKNCFIVRAHTTYRRSQMYLIRGGAGPGLENRWCPGLDDFDADDWEIIGFKVGEPEAY